MELPWCFIFMDVSVHMHDIYQADMGANRSVTCRDEDRFRRFSRAVFTVNDQIKTNRVTQSLCMVSIYTLWRRNHLCQIQRWIPTAAINSKQNYVKICTLLLHRLLPWYTKS